MFALDIVVSFDYPTWRFVQSLNVSNYVESLDPITKVYGAAVAELDRELYMARYAGPLSPGDLVLFDLVDLDGRIEFSTVTYLGTSPDNFVARTMATPTWIFWSQSKPENGITYRWTLRKGQFKNATQPFLTGEAFGPANAKNMGETAILYSSGPIDSNGGYRLSELDTQGMQWVDSLLVHNDTVPQLATIDIGDEDGFAVFGTVTRVGTMKLLLYQFGYY